MTSVKRTHFFALITILSVTISFIGLIAVYNASVVEAFNDFHDKYYFAKQQLAWLVLGLSAYFITSRFSSKLMKKISLPLFVFSLLMMLLVLIPGLRLSGARRWISLGPFRFQPSELLKTSLVVYLATWLESPKEMKKFAILLAFCLGLIMLQPDLGTAVIVATLGFGLFYLSGNKIREILLFFIALTAAAAVLIFASPYRLERLKTFNPGDIIDYRVARIPHFYPVYDIGYEKKIVALFDKINQTENIICTGRLGLCSYNNIDHCLDMGILIAKGLAQGKQPAHINNELLQRARSYRIID